jgi:hypothetical protein
MLAAVHQRGPFSMPTKPIYQSYLLRLWRDSPTAPWRALLQSTDNGEQYHFGEVADLFAFLAAGLGLKPQNSIPQESDK